MCLASNIHIFISEKRIVGRSKTTIHPKHTGILIVSTTNYSHECKLTLNIYKKIICNHIFKCIWVLQIKDYIKSTRLIFFFLPHGIWIYYISILSSIQNYPYTSLTRKQCALFRIILIHVLQNCHLFLS